MKRDRLLGIVLVLLGILFGIRSLGWVPELVEELLFRWEVVLMGIGLFFMMAEKQGRTGGILFLIGLIFWIPRSFDIPVQIDLWPVLLLLLGALLLYRSSGGKKEAPLPKGSKKGILQETVIFGDKERIVSEDAFEGAKLSIAFGEAKIDLTRCSWNGNEDRVIEVLVLFGSSTFHIPSEWQIDLEVSSIFGSFQDMRAQKVEAPAGSGRRLRIKGLCLFGEGKVRE